MQSTPLDDPRHFLIDILWGICVLYNTACLFMLSTFFTKKHISTYYYSLFFNQRTTTPQFTPKIEVV
jgi:hypothetical protein